jgi:hypothetical protein
LEQTKSPCNYIRYCILELMNLSFTHNSPQQKTILGVRCAACFTANACCAVQLRGSAPAVKRLRTAAAAHTAQPPRGKRCAAAYKTLPLLALPLKRAAYLPPLRDILCKTFYYQTIRYYHL